MADLLDREAQLAVARLQETLQDTRSRLPSKDDGEVDPARNPRINSPKKTKSPQYYAQLEADHTKKAQLREELEAREHEILKLTKQLRDAHLLAQDNEQLKQKVDQLRQHELRCVSLEDEVQTAMTLSGQHLERLSKLKEELVCSFDTDLTAGDYPA